MSQSQQKVWVYNSLTSLLLKYRTTRSPMPFKHNKKYTGILIYMFEIHAIEIQQELILDVWYKLVFGPCHPILHSIFLRQMIQYYAMFDDCIVDLSMGHEGVGLWISRSTYAGHMRGMCVWITLLCFQFVVKSTFSASHPRSAVRLGQHPTLKGTFCPSALLLEAKQSVRQTVRKLGYFQFRLAQLIPFFA